MGLPRSSIRFVGFGLACLLACATPPPFPEVVAWDAPSPASPSVEEEERKEWKDMERALEQLDEDELLYRADSLTRYLEDLIRRIAPHRSERAPALKVLVLEDAEHAASAVSDGTILISLPLLVSYSNEAQLAYILAHEVVHVVKRHSLRSTRYEALTPSHVERMRLSRSLEHEADTVALDLVAAAGLDPREAPNALTHTFRVSPEPTIRIYAWRSHHEPDFRTSVLRSVIRRRNPAADTGELATESFLRAMDAHRIAAAAVALKAEKYDWAGELVAQHLERLPEDGSAYALRARITSQRDPAERLSKAVGDDLEQAVRYGPKHADSLRTLGFFLRDTGRRERSQTIFRRYLAARPDAYDRKLIERYLSEAAD